MVKRDLNERPSPYSYVQDNITHTTCDSWDGLILLDWLIISLILLIWNIHFFFVYINMLYIYSIPMYYNFHNKYVLYFLFPSSPSSLPLYLIKQSAFCTYVSTNQWLLFFVFPGLLWMYKFWQRSTVCQVFPLLAVCIFVIMCFPYLMSSWKHLCPLISQRSREHPDFVCLSLPQCQHSSQRGPQAKCVSGINYGCHRAKLPQYLRWGIRPSMYLRRKTNTITILPRATYSVDTCDYLVS